MYPNCETNMNKEQHRRSFVACVCTAHSAHRTAQLFVRRGYAPHFIASAKAARDASLRGARHHLDASK